MAPTPEEALAIEQYALSVTVPLFITYKQNTQLHATGTLVEIDNRQFVITARHIFDDWPVGAELAFPENPTRASTHTFGNYIRTLPEQEHVDVAVMELRDPEAIAMLRRNWHFVTLDQVAAPSNRFEDGACFVAGYPNALTQMREDWLHGSFITAYTQRMPDVPEEAESPVDSQLDLFFDYGKEATSVSGKTIQTPKLPGVSGASVWELQPPPVGPWAPSKVAHVIGVQSSYIHAKFIRVKSWWAVAKVLEQVDTGLAAAVRQQLQL